MPEIFYGNILFYLCITRNFSTYRNGVLQHSGGLVCLYLPSFVNKKVTNLLIMENKTYKDFEVSTSRLEAFSDGVFAIAITLLIIEIKIPSQEDLKNQSLIHYVWQQWPKYFAYILSFVIIGIYWANHHYLFKLFKKTDHIFNLLNVFFLMAIAFLPYPSGILGEYIISPEHSKSAVSFYAFAIWLPAVSWLIIWLYAKHKKRIIDHRLSEDFIESLTKQYLISNLLYIAAFLISLVSSLISIITCVGLTLLYLLPPKNPEYIEHV
jgi:TMEM175 potassium channel family protein